MAAPVDFPGSNVILRPPPGREGDVLPVHAWRNGRLVVTCWELSVDELRAIVDSGRLYVSVMGETMPPLYVGTREEVRALSADYPPALPR